MRYLVVAAALGLATPALAAEQADQAQNEPVLMTEVQLDAVVAGQTCEALVCVQDVNVNAQIPVTAAVGVAANVLTSQSQAVANAENRGRILFNTTQQ
jgi:hypothetical protein